MPVVGCYLLPYMRWLCCERWWRMLALLLGRADDVPGQPGPQQLLLGVCNIVIASNNKDQVCRVVHSRHVYLSSRPFSRHNMPGPALSPAA
ncbi:hypothetical protein COO60DRAFT_1505088 [Scenedesmus sp. NREL 46B-D3]|nr:hypothetical protein COO60DRAFT_1505088 [Scenedesmus sp. NREL 46B-D3]